jgi:hypothetical protein
VDLGLRRTKLSFGGRDFGDVEARLWSGYLTESDYFDSDSSNNHNLISGFGAAYAPAILEGLTISLNRTYIAKWEADSLGTIPSLLFFHF